MRCITGYDKPVVPVEKSALDDVMREKGDKGINDQLNDICSFAAVEHRLRLNSSEFIGLSHYLVYGLVGIMQHITLQLLQGGAFIHYDLIVGINTAPFPFF